MEYASSQSFRAKYMPRKVLANKKQRNMLLLIEFMAQSPKTKDIEQVALPIPKLVMNEVSNHSKLGGSLLCPLNTQNLFLILPLKFKKQSTPYTF
jgi:hypothetical protein